MSNTESKNDYHYRGIAGDVYIKNPMMFDIDKHRQIARNYARSHYKLIESWLLRDKRN